MALPQTADLLIEQGARFTDSWRWERDGAPVDLSTYTALSQIRTKPGGALILDLADFVTLEPEGVTGRILLDIPASATARLAAAGKWDLFLVDDSAPDAVRLLAGRVKVELRVSQ